MLAYACANKVREDYPEVAEFILDMMQQQETLVVS